ncbi:hypothetical protein M9458_052376 [Cirrhinus mrigala]|uniref:Integrase catalytic domain-containing protein n=1 Tax=Cirrhinus mrigala TaxID=683832 RepID=A0ABD0MTX2_CIRMR
MKKVYYTPSNPGSLGGKKQLKDAVLKDTGVRLSDKQVSDWLAGEDAYTLHRSVPINYKRNRVVVYGVDMQFQADLVDMSAYSKENDNNKYLLTCIDVLSKYAWVRTLKNKSGVEVTEAFKSILEEGRIPKKLQTDKGTEFFNKHFQDLMKKHNILHFATATDVKASVAKRFNRSLKSRMWPFLTATNSRRYVDVLQDTVQGYNSSYHWSIRMRLLDVGKENRATVFGNLYSDMKNVLPIFKYKVGDVVRISKVRGPFTKGYEQNYTEEFFTISACIPRNPPVYRLSDYDGDVIDGVFYEEEIQNIIVSENKAFKVLLKLNILEVGTPLMTQKHTNKPSDAPFKPLPGFFISRKHQIAGGYYADIRSVIRAINEIAAPAVVMSYDYLKNKVSLVAKPNISISFHGKLAAVLGVKPDDALGRSAYHEKADFTTGVITDAPHQADINGGFYTMYVYTDIIEYQSVGDSYVPLLRCVHITGESNNTVSVRYDKPHYASVNKTHITDITVELKDDQNREIPFSYGKAGGGLLGYAGGAIILFRGLFRMAIPLLKRGSYNDNAKTEDGSGLMVMARKRLSKPTGIRRRGHTIKKTKGGSKKASVTHRKVKKTAKRNTAAKRAENVLSLSTGTYDKNPFAFKHYDLEFLAICVDGQQFPAKPLQPDFAGGSAVREFYQLATATGRHLKNHALAINREDFLKGYTLYAFNLTPDEDCGQHISLIKSGNIRLEARFKQPLPHTINLIVYAVFDSIVEVSWSITIEQKMDTVRLTAIMDKISCNTNFLGVLPSDYMPERPLRNLPAMAIVNTHPAELPGEHWLAVYLSQEGYGCFFDSFGNAPNSNRFPPSIKKFLITNSPVVLYSTKRVQDFTSDVCGQHCVFFLYHLARGRDYNYVLNLYSDDYIITMIQ